MIAINPKISIIVPVYRVENYLQQCVDSIMNQNFDDFEVLLIDDGSPDNCPAICDDYAAKDKRVHVIHQINRGTSVARNVGIDHACGEYICFIDGDDILHPDYCKVLYDAIVGTGCKIASCQMTRFTGESVLTRDSFDGVTTLSYSSFLKKQMRKEIDIGVCNKLFQRSVFENVRFIPDRRYEDVLLMADLLCQDIGNIAYVEVPLYYYRQRENSYMNSQSGMQKCSPDCVFAGNYLLQRAKEVGYEYMEECLLYAVKYPWYFVDPVYVHFRFRENKQFFSELQKLIRDHREEYKGLVSLSDIQRKRMMLFACSKIAYGFNAYARLLRVYIYRLLKRDAYADGHGI